MKNISKQLYRFERKILKTLFLLPDALKQKIAGESIRVNNAELELNIRLVFRLLGSLPQKALHVSRLRKYLDRYGGHLMASPNHAVSINDLAIPGPYGKIRLRTYAPENLESDNSPALIYFHGGGFVAGSIKSHDLPCQRLALACRCKVISVDYRLAPENPYPIPVIEAIHVFRHLVATSQAFGIDPNKLAVGGDSAGGNLAAVVAQQTKNDATPPCFQFLLAPWLDLSQERKSYHAFASGYFLERSTLRWFKKQYLSVKSQQHSPLASPMLGELSGVCPALIFAAGFDPLRDDAIEYAKKLNIHKVRVTLTILASLPHIFINIADSSRDASNAFNQIAQAIMSEFDQSQSLAPA